MPDTGEKGELRSRVNAKEAETEAESTKLSQMSKPLPDRKLEIRRVTAKRRKEVKGH